MGRRGRFERGNLGLVALLALVVCVFLWIALDRPARQEPATAVSMPGTPDAPEPDLHAPESAERRPSAPVESVPNERPEVQSQTWEPRPKIAARLRVQGRVVDREGNPIESAELALLERTVARTGADGTIDAEVELAEPTGWGESWTVSARGYVSVEHWLLDTANDATLQLGTIVLASGAEVAGQVIDDKSRPVPGARVFACTPWAYPGDPASAESARTDDIFDDPGWFKFSPGDRPRAASDAAGRFLLRGLPEAEQFLVASAEGYQYGWTELFRPPSDSAREFSIVLLREPGTHRTEGIVLDPDGRPVSRARLGMFIGKHHQSWRQAGDDGRFVLMHAEGHGGSFDLTASDPEQRWAPVRLEDLRHDAGFLEVRLGAPDWLIVRLEDAEHRPVPWGHARGKLLETSDDSSVAIPMADADERGLLRFQRPMRAFQLDASAPGSRTQTFGPFEPPARGEELVLTLTSGQALRGRVVSEGRPIAGARVGLAHGKLGQELHESDGVTPCDRPFLATGSIDLSRFDATTDAEGRFVATLHWDGVYLVSVQADGFPLAVRGPFSWTGEAGVEGFEVVLERGGAIEGRVFLPPGAAVDGRFVGACDGWNVAHTAPVRADGTYRIEDLSPGLYQVRPCIPPVLALHSFRVRSGTLTLEWDCRVIAGETASFDLDLSDEGSVRLDGQAAFREPAYWEASLCEPRDEWEGPVRARTQVDPAGKFELALSRPGTYWLSFGDGIGGYLRTSVELAPGLNEWRAPPHGSVRVRAKSPGTLRFVCEDGLFRFQRPFAFSEDDSGAEEVVFDVPCGPGRIERSVNQDGKSAWILAVPCEVRSDVETLVEIPEN